MCYVYNQWYDISCAILYHYALQRVTEYQWSIWKNIYGLFKIEQ